MNDRIKEHIFIPEAPLEVIMAVAGIVTFVAGIMVIILLPLFGKKKSKPVKADVFASPYRSYEELSQFLSGALATNGYHLVKTSTLEPEGAVSVYTSTVQIVFKDAAGEPVEIDESIAYFFENITRISYVTIMRKYRVFQNDDFVEIRAEVHRFTDGLEKQDS